MTDDEQVGPPVYSHQVPTAERCYYGERYWNELDAVQAHHNRKITGEPDGGDLGWARHVVHLRGGPFDRALILNCGNGSVDRRLLELGLFREAVGIDISEPLLVEADRESTGLPLRYERMDVNTAVFPDGPFDVVLNVAAAHHVAHLDRVFRRLCELLPDDGWFVSHDYVGPHRNQYPYDQWAAAWEANQRLPGPIRQDLRYPHLPTMLAVDPTEAIHSERILETFRRYFDPVQFTPLGGAVAYLLFTHNNELINTPGPWAGVIEDVLAVDDAYLAAHPDSTMFAFWIGQPRKVALRDVERLACWTREEDERERAADAAGSEYYPRTALQDLALQLAERTVAAEHARAWALELQAANERLRGLFDTERSGHRRALDALDELRQSTSWRMTAPLRRLFAIRRRT